MVTPRPVESNQNALKSGLDAESQFVVGEDREEFVALQHEYIARFQPLTPEERFQVDTLIRNEWTLRRLFRAEAHLWEYHALRADRSEGVPLGAALMAADQVFRRLQRRVTLAERSYKDAFAELERLRRAGHSSQSQADTGDSPKLGLFLHPGAAGPSGPPPPFPAASSVMTIPEGSVKAERANTIPENPSAARPRTRRSPTAP